MRRVVRLHARRAADRAPKETSGRLCPEPETQTCAKPVPGPEACGFPAEDVLQILPGDKPVVITVDDEPIILNGNLRVLSRVLPNAEICGFQTASDALDFAKTKTVDVAFLDIELQAANGITLARELQTLNPNTNVVFVSSYAQYMNEAMEVDASGFLNKPLKKEKILQSISSLHHPVMGLI